MKALRILLWVLAGVVGLLLALLLAGYVSWQLALDRDFEHSKATEALPLFPEAREGLVRVSASGMEFRTRLDGFDQEGPVIIMLHGFPETSIMWAPLMDAAEASGMRAVAFDQRGYSPGARPESLQDYALPALVGDVFALTEALGVDRFHLVGHDWGAAVVWSAAMQRDARLLSVTALSIPHAAAFVEAVRSDPEQQRRSSYMAVFRTPILAEYLFGTLDMGLLKAMHAGNNEDLLDEYLNVFSEPGAMTAALNWYRSSALDSAGPDQSGPSPMVAIPTLFIGGTRDAAVAASSVEAQSKYISGPFESHMRDAGHWLMGEDTDFVVSTILEFVRRHDAAVERRS